MIKKIGILILLFFISFFYLRQKINIYVEGYRLNDAQKVFDKLVDRRDALLYNFSQKVSLAKINGWIEAKGFDFAKEDRILAFNISREENKEKRFRINFLASPLKRLFRVSGVSKALAEQR